MSNQSGIKAGRAYVELYAKSALSEGFRKAEAQIREFASKVQFIGASVGAAGAAVLAPLALATKSFASKGDDFAKMSKRVGATTEELSKLAYAAELSGTSIESVEAATKRLQKNLYDAAQGTGETKDAFEQLGLSAQDLKSKTPTEAFGEIADRLKLVTNANDRAAMAMKIFGKSGTDLLPMLEAGKIGLNGMFQEAEKLGLVVSGETAASAAKLKDELGRLGAVAKQIGFVIGAALSDEVQKTTRSIVEGAVRVGAWIKEHQRAVVVTAKVAATMTAAGIAIAALGKTIQIVVSVVKALTLAKMALVKAMAVAHALMGPKGWIVLAGSLAVAAGAVYALEKSFDSINQTAVDSEQKVSALKDIGDGAAAAAIQIRQARNEVRDLSKTPLHALGVEADELGLDEFEKVKLQMQKDGTWSKDAEELMRIYKTAILEKRDALSLDEAAKKIIEDQKTAQQLYNEEVAKLNRLLEKRLLTQGQYNQELDRQQKILADATRDPIKESKQRQAETVYENTRTPLERYIKEVERLNQLRKEGYLNEDTYRRAIAAEKDRLPKIESTLKLERAVAQSTAVGDFSSAGRFGMQGESSADRTAKATEEIAKNTREIALNQREEGSTI